MKFVRAIWKLLVGIKDALVLLLMLLFFGGLYGVLSARPAPVRAACSTSTSTEVSSNSRQADWSDVASSGASQQHRLRDLVAALDDARGRQPREGRRARPRRVRRRRSKLRWPTSRKRCAGSGVGQAGSRLWRWAIPTTSYHLASAASEIWLNPLGAVVITGPGGSDLYYKGLLDKLGVTANVYRVGNIQGGGRTYIRNDMSPERSRIVSRSTRHRSKPGDKTSNCPAQSQHRPVPPRHERSIAAAGGDMAKAALRRGPGRQCRRPPEFEERLAQLGGKASSGADPYQRIKLGILCCRKGDRQTHRTDRGRDGRGHDRRWQRRRRERRRRHDREGDRGRNPQQGDKGLVMRVDSPGRIGPRVGAYPPGALEAKSRKIPVVVSMGASRHPEATGYRRQRLHFCGALDHYRVDRRVRRTPEFPGDPSKVWHWSGRGEDFAAFGRARPAEGAVARSKSVDSGRSEAMYAASSTSLPQLATRPR